MEKLSMWKEMNNLQYMNHIITSFLNQETLIYNSLYVKCDLRVSL